MSVFAVAHLCVVALVLFFSIALVARVFFGLGGDGYKSALLPRIWTTLAENETHRSPAAPYTAQRPQKGPELLEGTPPKKEYKGK